jgi:ethanolamine transporter EutH
MHARLITLSTIASLLLPAIASAQNIQSVFLLFSNLLNALIGMLITIAIVVFFWGLIKYLLHDGSSEDAHKGIHQMIWGVIAIFVMVSIWGLVALLQRTFGVDNNQAKVPAAVPLRWVQ